ncbi:unnamed protein product [Calypogeia fissa]
MVTVCQHCNLQDLLNKLHSSHLQLQFRDGDSESQFNEILTTEAGAAIRTILSRRGVSSQGLRALHHGAE